MLCAGGISGSVHIFFLAAPEEVAAPCGQKQHAEESTSSSTESSGSFSFFRMAEAAASMVSAAVQIVPSSISSLDFPRYSSIVRIPTNLQIQHVWCGFARRRRGTHPSPGNSGNAGEYRAAKSERLVLVYRDEKMGHISLHDVSTDTTETQLHMEHLILGRT